MGQMITDDAAGRKRPVPPGVAMDCAAGAERV